MNNEQQQIIDEVYNNYRQENKHVMYLTFLLEDEFIRRIKHDTEFSEKWGLKVEERGLSEDERYDLCAAQKSKMTAISEEDYIKYNIPTKLITITYNNKTIKSYE